MAEEFFVPKLGQTVEEVTLLGWQVEDGARVEQGQTVMEVETDKAVFPVEANATGYIHLGPHKAGEVLPVLTVVAVIGKKDDKFGVTPLQEQGTTAGAAAAATTAPAASVAAGGQPVAATLSVTTQPEGRVFASPRARRLAADKDVDLRALAPTGGGGARVAERDVLAYLSRTPRATPVAQKMAAEAGVDLRQMVGTGPGGKVTREDVERAVKVTAAVVAPAAPTVPPPTPPAPPLPVAEILERVPLKGVRRTIAERMATSVRTTAAVTLTTEADATDLVRLRGQLKGESAQPAPSYNDLFAKLSAHALLDHPELNARFEGDSIVRSATVNIAIAVDTERGLLAPVVRDVQAKSLRQVAREAADLIERARAGRIHPEELRGGTFTITNLGMYEIDAFTPIINLPECAILGVGRIVAKQVVTDAGAGQVAIRHMVVLSLTFDHRLVDGAPAARLLQKIKRNVEKPYIWLAGA